MKKYSKEFDFMELALCEAREAALRGEVPVGAVIVRPSCKGDKMEVVSRGRNSRERSQSALAHAEINAIKIACRRLKSWRLDDCTMYVTLQPCPMCAGAIVNARIGRVIIGARAEKNVGGKSDAQLCDVSDCSLEIYSNNNLNFVTKHEFNLRVECSQILKDFFASKRGG